MQAGACVAFDTELPPLTQEFPGPPGNYGLTPWIPGKEKQSAMPLRWEITLLCRWFSGERLSSLQMEGVTTDPHISIREFFHTDFLGFFFFFFFFAQVTSLFTDCYRDKFLCPLQFSFGCQTLVSWNFCCFLIFVCAQHFLCPPVLQRRLKEISDLWFQCGHEIVSSSVVCQRREI